MEWVEWEPVYQDIVHRLNIDPAQDRKATQVLTQLLKDCDPQPLLKRIDELVSEKIVVIGGAGPSLENHLNHLKGENIDDYSIVGVDGASTAFLENGIDCDIIVTDLDGNLDDIGEHQKKGAVVVLHAHGDNMEVICEHVPSLLPALGSTQVEPTNRAFLWGGFTDGDRATHLVSAYSPKRIILAGMDFGTRVGKWSKPGHLQHYEADSRKEIKLAIAKELTFVPLKRAKIDYLLMG